jgi:hypothetical protein
MGNEAWTEETDPYAAQSALKDCIKQMLRK